MTFTLHKLYKFSGKIHIYTFSPLWIVINPIEKEINAKILAYKVEIQINSKMNFNEDKSFYKKGGISVMLYLLKCLTPISLYRDSSPNSVKQNCK